MSAYMSGGPMLYGGAGGAGRVVAFTFRDDGVALNSFYVLRALRGINDRLWQSLVASWPAVPDTKPQIGEAEDGRSVVWRVYLHNRCWIHTSYRTIIRALLRDFYAPKAFGLSALYGADPVMTEKYFDPYLDTLSKVAEEWKVPW